MTKTEWTMTVSAALLILVVILLVLSSPPQAGLSALKTEPGTHVGYLGPPVRLTPSPEVADPLARHTPTVKAEPTRLFARPTPTPKAEPTRPLAFPSPTQKIGR